MTHAEYLTAIAALPQDRIHWLRILELEMWGDWDEPHEAPDEHWDRVYEAVERRMDREYPYYEQVMGDLYEMTRLR